MRRKLLIILLRLLTPHRKRTDTNNAKVFILSTGRTATNFLAGYFSAIPGVNAVHEPKPSWRARLLSGARLEGYATNADLKRALLSLRDFSKVHADTIYIESNPMLFGFSPAILTQLPDAKIAHIIRDPREYIRSAIEHGNQRGTKGFLNRHLPFWIANPLQAVDLSSANGTTKLLAQYWNLINQQLIDDNRNNKNYKLFRFEELFSDQKSFDSLIKFSGIDPKQAAKPAANSKKTNKGTSDTKDYWQNWSDEEIAITDQYCGKLMKTFGYGTEKKWEQRLEKNS